MEKLLEVLQEMDAVLLKTELLSFIEDDSVEAGCKYDFVNKFCDYIIDDLTNWM